jgi:tetratricopeptide (TPR) repeat protein
MTHLTHSTHLARPVHRLWVLAIVGVSILSACSGLSRKAAPESTYIPDASYYLLMAEIALQRKAYLIAAEQYLNAAVLGKDPELAKRATEFAAEYGYDSFTLSGAHRWLELEPQNLAAHEYAGRIYLRRYDTEHAYTHLTALLGDAQPPDDEAFLILSADLAAEENTAGVTVLFKRLARQYPDSAGLQLALARTAMRSGDTALVLFAADKVSDTYPDSLESPLLIAQALMAQGHEIAALEQIRSLRSEPVSIAVELEYIRLLAASGQIAQANEQFENLAKIYGVQPDFVRMHALVNLAAGDFDTAARDFNKLLSAGKNVYECFYYLGRIAVLRGEPDVGIDYFSRVRSGAYLLQAQLAQSLAYQGLNEQQAALDSLQAFTQAYPRHALAVMPMRAQLLFDLGETQQALAVFDELMGFRPDSVELLLAYGAMLDQTGELKQSLTSMRRAVELAPMDANTLNTLGYTLANRTRQHAEAYRLIRQALELSPDSAAIIDSMGWVLYRLGRHEEALSYLEQAYALMDDPEVVVHLAELLQVMGELDSARSLLDESLLKYPDNELLSDAQARLSQ